MRTVIDYEKKAAEVLPRYAWDFYCTGSEEEKSLKRNRDIWKSILIIPRALCNVNHRNQHISLMNGRFIVTSPICVSPTAFNKFAHPEAEKAVAKACSSLNMLYCVSGVSSYSIEEIAEAAPKSLRWQNIYLFKSPPKTLEILRRAEACGVGAIVVSVDINELSLRSRGLRPDGLGQNAYHNILADRSTWAGNFPPYDTLHVHSDPAGTWDTLRWVISNTKLPVVVKGILNPSDALKAIECGVSAIVVSNHGGRQLDSVPAAVEMLPHIIEAVADKVDVYVDGGIRFGTDVYKALALGAKAVFVGRPALFGLAVNGEDGVKHVLSILRDELDIAMALTGCSSVNDIRKDSLVLESKLLPAKL